MKILLIRHSKTIADKDKSSLLWKLSDEGITLAKKLSENKYIKQCQVIYSSQQTKAIETALLLAKNNYIPIKTNANLTETTSVTNGYFANFDFEVAKWHQGNYRILDGETKDETLLRFNKAVSDIAAKETDQDMIGIVAHGNVLAIFTQQFLDMESFEIHKNINMPDLALLDYDNKKFIFDWGNYHD